MPVSNLSQSKKGQRNPLGLSSYRLTMAASLNVLTCNDGKRLSDELWLNYLAGFLNAWFKYEHQLPCATVPTVLETVKDDLDHLTYQHFLDEMRPHPYEVVPNSFESDPFP